jgi:RimJ/RimL family protein N-acetyltransferase
MIDGAGDSSEVHMHEHGKEPHESVFLRPLELSDLPRIHRWHNDEQLYAYFSKPHRFVSMTAVENWLRSQVAYSAERLSLAICRKEDGEHIGNIYLRSIDPVARHAEVALFIAESSHRSRGHGQAAIRLIVTYAFGSLGLLRLYLTALADNERAIKAYERCGFQLEGRLRRHAYKDGQFKDVVLMGLCAGETRQP